MADSAKDFVVKQNLRVTGNIVSAGAGSVFTGDGAQLDNVDAVTLGGESGGFYRDATNLNAGTISNDRLPATITKNLTGNVTGNVDATGGSGTVDADSGRFTTISGTTASFNTYVGVYGNFDTFDQVFDSSFTRDTFKANVFDPVFDSSLSRKSADDISDGITNKFYTTARFDSDFGIKSTTDLTEGSNLYYTEARVDSDITTTINKTFVDALNINADQVDGVEATSFVRSDQDDTIGANIQFTDGNELRLGTGNDTIIKHTGTQTTVNHTGTGNLVFQADEQTRFTITDNGTTASGLMSTDSINSTGNITATLDLEAYRDVKVDNWLWIYESANGGVAGHLEGTASGGLEIHYHSITPSAGLSIYSHDSQSLVGSLQTVFSAQEGISFENNKLHNVADPISNQDAATKAYVDNTSQGLVVKDGVKAASTADLSTLPNVGTVTYNNTAGPDSGVGSGFSFTGQLDSIDGYTLTTNDRVLIKNQTNEPENGIYRWVNNTTLTRAVDADQDSELGGGVFVFVENGTINASNGYVTSHSGLTNVGTDSIIWTQFSGAGFIEAGDGLIKTGNVIDVNLSDGAGGTSGLKVETDQLKINLGAGGTGLEISSNVLQIADDGVGASKVNFGLGAGQISTADLPEDSVSGNTYFTVARARNALSYDSNGIVTYDYSTGQISSLSLDSIFSQKFANVDSSNVIIGFNTYDSVAGTFNVIIGYEGASQTEDVDQSVVVGYQAGKFVKDINNSVLIGDRVNAPGDGIRFYGGANLSSLTDAVVIGTEAMGGQNDVIIGNQANFYGRTSEFWQSYNTLNVMMGYQAGYMASYSSGTNTGNIFSQRSVIMGGQAGYEHAHRDAVIIGHNAAKGTSSAGLTSSNRDNVVIGVGAFLDMKAGQADDNVAIGKEVLYNAGNTQSADENVFIGERAGYNAGQTARILRNIMIGSRAGYTLNGDFNIGIGYYALDDATGDYNTSIGYQSGLGTQSNAAASLTGNDNIFLGFNAKPVNTNTSNTMVIGSATVSEGIQRLEIPAMTDATTGHGVGSILTLLEDGDGRYIGFDSAPSVLDSASVAPYARAAISVVGDGVSYEQGTGVITISTVTNSFQVTQAGHGLREGHAVYEDDVAGWVKALATDSGHQLATHVVVDFVDSDTFGIAQNGIFTIGETGSVSPAISLTAGEYYYTGNVDSGVPVIAQPATSVQPLFYALSSTQIELNVEHAINVFSPDEPLNVSSTAGNFTVTGNLKINGLGVPKVATVSPGGTYYFDSGNVAKLTMTADASMQFDSPGTLYDGAGFTILAKNTDASAHRLTLTTPNGVTLHTVGENKVTVNAGNIAILSGVIYGEKDILLTSTQMDSSITG